MSLLNAAVFRIPTSFKYSPWPCIKYVRYASSCSLSLSEFESYGREGNYKGTVAMSLIRKNGNLIRDDTRSNLPAATSRDGKAQLLNELHISHWIA